MPIIRVEIEGKQIVLHQAGGIGCTTPEDIAGSTAFSEVVSLYVRELHRHKSPLLEFCRRSRSASKLASHSGGSAD